MGVSIEESKLVLKKKILKDFHKKCIHIVASLEQVLGLNTTTFEDIVGSLKSYEEHIFEEEEPQEDQRKLMYGNMESQTDQSNRDFNGDFRNRGRGGHFYYR